MSRTALFTAVYPGALAFFAEWHASVRAQTEQGFDLWIALDGCTSGDLERAATSPVRARFCPAPPGSSPAEVRNAGLLPLLAAADYDAVVLVDSDDILFPQRVSSALRLLDECDACACAMDIVDESGAPAGLSFGLPAAEWSPSLLARENVFGFSNSAYRATHLRAALPIPKQAIAVDWLVATRIAARGARLRFDPESRMAYRQHAYNVARSLPPFRAEDVQRATRLVLEHYELLAAEPLPDVWRDAVQRAQADARIFCKNIQDGARLQTYIEALNALPPRLTWWSAVARPGLEHLWKH